MITITNYIFIKIDRVHLSLVTLIECTSVNKEIKIQTYPRVWLCHLYNMASSDMCDNEIQYKVLEYKIYKCSSTSLAYLPE